MGALAEAKLVGIICTRDAERAIPFYRDTLGLKLASTDRFATVFEVGGIAIRLSTVPDFVPHNHTVVGFEIEHIESKVKELADKGVKFNIYEHFRQDPSGIWTAPDGDARVAWFNDPDGNVLSLTEL